MNILKILTVENQKNLEIFNLIESFFEILKIDDHTWLKNFILWELKVYKSLGYDIDFKIMLKVKINGVEEFIVENTQKIILIF